MFNKQFNSSETPYISTIQIINYYIELKKIIHYYKRYIFKKYKYKYIEEGKYEKEND